MASKNIKNLIKHLKMFYLLILDNQKWNFLSPNFLRKMEESYILFMIKI